MRVEIAEEMHDQRVVEIGQADMSAAHRLGQLSRPAGRLAVMLRVDDQRRTANGARRRQGIGPRIVAAGRHVGMAVGDEPPRSTRR